jgi:hypothetical protein
LLASELHSARVTIIPFVVVLLDLFGHLAEIVYGQLPKADDVAGTALP